MHLKQFVESLLVHIKRGWMNFTISDIVQKFQKDYPLMVILRQQFNLGPMGQEYLNIP